MLINFHCTVIKVPLLYHRPTPSLIHTDHHTPTPYPSVAELLDIVILFLHKFCSLEEQLSGLLGIPNDSRDNWTWTHIDWNSSTPSPLQTLLGSNETATTDIGIHVCIGCVFALHVHVCMYMCLCAWCMNKYVLLYFINLSITVVVVVMA